MTARRRPLPHLVRRRRQTWLERRAARGLERPLPLGVLDLNAMSVSTGPEHAKQILRNGANALPVVDGVTYQVDVILGCEGDDFDAAKVLGRDWDVHHDQTHPDRDGAFMAIRKSRGHLEDAHLVKGSDPLPGVLPARWIVAGILSIDPGTRYRWFLPAAAGHLPPMRAFARWGQYLNNFRQVGAALNGADFNKAAAAVAVAFGRRVGGRGVMFLATSWWIPVSKVVAVDVNGDHLAVFRVLFPHPKEK